MQKHTVLKASALALALAFAPSAYAADAPSRNTGVGKEIAAQGNRALAAIKAELKASLGGMARPALPAKARVVKMSQPGGAILATGSAVRCAE